MGTDDADPYGSLITEFDAAAEEFLDFDDIEYPEAETQDAEGEQVADEQEQMPKPPAEQVDDPDDSQAEDPEGSEPEPQPTAPSGVDPDGPPVVAVCGTAGGAGTSTVTALMAFIAAEQNRGPVLLTDMGGPASALSALIGKKAGYSLGSAANAHRIGLFATNGTAPFEKVNSNLRLMSKEPDALDLTTSTTDKALTELLQDAQEDHYATFVDCGRLEQAGEQQIAAAATHVVWVVGATRTDARKARSMISSLGFSGTRGSFLYVRSTGEQMPDMPVQEELGLIADENALAIVVSPPVGDLVAQGIMPTAARAKKPLGPVLERILR